MPTALCITCLALWFAVTPSFASSSLHSHETIREEARQFAEQSHADARRVEVSVNALDPRLKLKLCTNSLNLFWPPGAPKTGHTTLGVSCEDAQPWKIYIRALIHVYQNVAVLTESVSVGDVVTKQNIRMEMLDLSGIRSDTITDFEPLLNHRFKRRYASGRPLTRSMVAPPRLIKKGEGVTLLASSDRLNVRMKGVALSDGEKGAMLQVRNLSSQRIIEGQVVAKGVVRILP